MQQAALATACGGLVSLVVVVTLTGLAPEPAAPNHAAVVAPSTPRAQPVQPPSPDPSVAADRLARALAAHGGVEGQPPTEHWLDDGAEARQKTARKRWFREMHDAGPDVDWEAIELENGLAQIDKRNRLARGFPPPPETAQGAWQERGSQNVAGRMHVARHSTDGSLLYGGSSKGGVWRRPIDGGTWEPLGDNLYGGAHWLLLFDPGDGGSDVMLAATDGGLVHRSDDDGASWERPSGLDTTHRVRRALKSSDGSETSWLVVGHWTGRSYDHRLVRSTDDGRSFRVLRQLGTFQADVWTPRTGDDTLWLVDADGVHRSDDRGDAFTKVSDLPTGGWNRAELTGSEATGRLWLVVSEGGTRRLFRSDTGGASWDAITNVDDYWGTLNASTLDPDLFAWGGVEVHRTFDGGDNFDVVNKWGEYYRDPANMLHADNPGMDVIPVGDGEVWYFNTDGGLYHSVDQVRTVQNLSLDGLRVSQYYDVHTSKADSSHIAAGAQDQGYQSTQRRGTPQDDELYEFDQLLSGDYAHLTSSDDTHAVVYSVYPGFMLISVGEDEAGLFRADFPDEDDSVPHQDKAWLPPIVADPLDPFAVFFCAEQLWRYIWSDARNEWVPEVWSRQDFVDSDGEYISALTFSPLDPNRAYLATNRGRIFVSDDHAKTWRLAHQGAPTPHYFYSHGLVASAEDLDVAYIGGNGYNGGGVLRTTDGGDTWQAWDEGLPPTLVYGMVEARDGSGKIFAATETAAYMRRREVGGWVDLTGADAPVTTYWSVEALHDENTIRFGTYGRGIWDWQQDPEGTGCVQDQDRDRDGVACDLDCNDDDPDIRPGVADTCDGVDMNCDGSDFVEVDADGDGFLACEECDDGEATAFPGAAEVRGNDIDEDCDGKAQKGCGCASAPGSAALGLLLLPLALIRRRR